MDTICGYRMLRRLGSGSRAGVYLVRPLDADDDAAARPSALKVFHAETSTESIGAEIDALSRLSSPFLVGLRDLGSAPDGRPALVLAPIGPLTVSRLVLERERIGAGEAVTILAPLADAAGELARAGVRHGRIRLDRVGFDEVGTPVLFGFGHASVRDGVSGPETVDGAIDPERGVEQAEDTIALAALARSVLERTGPEISADLLAWLTAPIGRPELFRDELRERLFDLAEPEPVLLTPAPGRVPRHAPRVAVPDQVDHDGGTPAADWITALHLPQWVHDLLPTRVPAPGWLHGGLTLPELRGRIRSFFAPVRRPVWIAAGSVAALMVATLLTTNVSGSGTSSGAASVAHSETTSSVSPEDEDGGAEASGTGTSGTGPNGTGPGGTGPGGTGSGGTGSTVTGATAPGADDAAPWSAGSAVDPAITGEDPAAAARALLLMREACIDTRSVLCLDAVAQQGSAALEADSVLVRGLQEGADDAGRADLASVEAALVEHLGGSAIVSLTLSGIADAAPGTVLLVRGPDGWRIRDLIIG